MSTTEHATDWDALARDEQKILEKSQYLSWWITAAGVKIKDKVGHEIPFEFNVPQTYVHRWRVAAEKKRGGMLRGLCLKARQEGVSTYFGIDALHDASTKLNRECYMILQGLDEADKLFTRTIEYAYDRLDPYFKPGQKRRSIGRKLILETGSTLFVDSAQKPGAGRSGTLHKVHATELPDWPDPEETLTGITEAVPDMPGTSIMIESTAKGPGDYLHHLWQKCKDGKGPYEPLFLPWTLMPQYARKAQHGEIQRNPLLPDEIELMKQHGLTIRQILFRRDKIMRLGYKRWLQEYPLTADELFRSTGRLFFPFAAIERHRNRGTVSEPDARYDIAKVDEVIVNGREKGVYELVERDEGDLQVWIPPKDDMRVIVAGDIATAEGFDKSVGQVLAVDGEKIDQVAVWHGDIAAVDFAFVMAFLGNWYGKGLLAPELNNMGHATVGKLLEIYNRARIYRDIRIDTETGTESQVYGFPTNVRTRTPLLEQLYDYIRTFDLTLRHEETLNEMHQFEISKSGRPQAPKGGRDDCVISLGIGCYCRHRVGTGRVARSNNRSARY